jgi:hypothetical protein
LPHMAPNNLRKVVTIPVSQALGVYCNNNYPTNGTKLA